MDDYNFNLESKILMCLVMTGLCIASSIISYQIFLRTLILDDGVEFAGDPIDFIEINNNREHIRYIA